MRIAREHVTSAELDQLELSWWNENADLVARVWEMDEDISRTARGTYLQRARRFLLGDRREATILEIGCGSGWVGQLIAGPDLRMLGVDFSASQIELARARAARRGLDRFCRYELSNAEGWVRHVPEVDGVLIHCVLHHLNGQELEVVLNSLSKSLKPDARIWIYEPAFFAAGTPSAPPTRDSGQALWRAGRIAKWLGRLYRMLGLLDGDTVQSFQQLQAKANQNGWYLSPKEVPFDREGFTRELERYFVVHGRYWATVFLIGWVYESNLVRVPAIRSLVNRFFVPVLAEDDAVVARDEAYLASVLTPPGHAFHVWECQRRPS